MLSVSHVAIYYWIKSFGANLERLKSDDEIEIVELDEMHSYIGEKNCCWIWIAVDRLGKRFISFTIGDRSADTGRRLWDGAKDKAVSKVMTNYWQAYQQVIPLRQACSKQSGDFHRRKI